MVYTAGETRTLRVDSEVLGHAQPWTVTHRGLEYPGEVIVAETVNAEWGRPPDGDLTFRIVLYTVPRRIPAGQIRDPRIAMAIPRRAADSTRASLGRELQAIHEAKARYVTENDPDIRAVRSSIQERETILLGELSRRDAISYSQGRIYTHSRISLRPAGIFGEGMVSSWVDRLALGAFEQAYPTALFDELPNTLTAEGIEAVFRGLFQSEPDAVEVAGVFGPALGLTRLEAPSMFDARRCRAIDLIVREVGADGAEMPAQDLVQRLCAGYGLNRPLATLYLLTWVRRAHGEVELIPDHSVQRRGGGRFPSDRVSWDLVPEIHFTRSIADQLGVVRARPSPSWNAVLPYASLLVDELQLSQDPTEIEKQERLLISALGELAQRLEASREAVVALAASLEEAPDKALATIDRLQVLCSTTSHPGFHEVAENSFDGPSGLSQALKLHQRLEELARLAPAITRSRNYLAEMTFGRDHQDLAMRRDAVVGRIGLDSLTDNPSLWKSVHEGFDRLRREYVNTYLSHHARYHQESIELLSRLEASRPQIEALDRLNKVPEFGGPLETDIPTRFGELMTSVKTCTVPEDEVSLEAAPFCQACAVPLAEEPPSREVSTLLTDLDKAMRVYNRRLSSEGVRRVLAHPTKEQLDKFINLVQVSDLSVLANVLDDQVVEFLRGFVRPTL